MSIDDILFEKLEKRKEQGLLRSLKPLREDLIDFSSNDYLGLARNKKLQASIERIYKTEAQKMNGSGGSRLLAGNYPQIEALEALLHQVHGNGSALVFNSGYNANLAVFSSIPQKGDIVLYDEYIHACVKDGLRLSLSKFFSFKHNNLEDLEKKLQKFNNKRVFIAIEGIYSMDGDLAPLKEICDLATKYSAEVIIDEAHSTGVYGKDGAGLVTHLGLDDHVYIKVHTFGKAIGVHGAVVNCSGVVKDYLINYARSFIYTTSMTLHTVIAIQESYKYIQNNSNVQEGLFNVISEYQKLSGNSENKSPIQTFISGSNKKAKELASTLQKNKLAVYPVMSPTVPLGTERIRVCLHGFNTKSELDTLATILKEQV